MVFRDIKPHTKADLIVLQQLLSTTKTIEGAQSTFPETVLKYTEAKMKEEKKTFETVVNDIKRSLSDMKCIKIYLSLEPSKQLVERISRSLNLDNTDRYIEFIRDESLIGGAKVVIDGKQYDETIDRLIYEKCL